MRFFSTILSCYLRCIRSVFLRTSKAHFPSRRPRYYLPFCVCQRNDYIVKTRLDVSFPNGVNFDVFLLLLIIFRHINNYYLVALFLLATVFLLPFLVLELFLVLCPLSGNPIL